MKVNELLENKTLASIKQEELIFGNYLLHVINGISLEQKHIKKHAALLSAAKQFQNFTHCSNVKLLSKPSGHKPTYGSGMEPKTDLIVVVDNKEIYNISYKGGNSYILSAGTKEEYTGLINASLHIYNLYYPEENKQHKDMILEVFKKIERNIGRTNKKDYNTKQLADKMRSWYKNVDNQLAKSNQETVKSVQYAIDNKEAAILQLKQDSALKDNNWKTTLHNMEYSVKGAFYAIFNANQQFAQCYVWEALSGIYKFNAFQSITRHETESAAADTIVSLNKGVFDISHIDDDFIISGVQNFGVRLQNVPRGNVDFFIGAVNKNSSERTVQLLIDCLTEVEMCLKVGIDKNETFLKTFSLKEDIQLQEFFDDKINSLLQAELDINVALSKLLTVMHKASLSELCCAFGYLPKITIQ